MTELVARLSRPLTSGAYAMKGVSKAISSRPLSKAFRLVQRVERRSFTRCKPSFQQAAEGLRPQFRTVSWDVTNKEITFDFPDDGPRQFPFLWLRDHCQCAECTHPHTKQRQVDTFQVMKRDLSATSIEPHETGLRVLWRTNSHESFYPWTWLRDQTLITSEAPKARSWKHVKPSIDPEKYPTASFNDIMNAKTTTGLAQWLSQIRTYGYSFISDTPHTPEATSSLLKRIAFIRPTHYGAFWDFSSSPSPTDTAYTNLGLPNHTDTTYFTDPCGLQLFHVLQPATEGGGESTLVDGFAAAEYLYYSDPAAYKALSTARIVSHASGNADVGSIDNSAANSLGFPVFNHHALSELSPESLSQIRWNNDDRHSRTQWSSWEAMDAWYEAAAKWSEILTLPEFEIEVQLLPGKPVIFDNWRVLHGRRAFAGGRRVCGGYIGMDDFLARWRSVTGGKKV